MRIEYIDGGFVHYLDNQVIEKIVCTGETVKIGTKVIELTNGKRLESDVTEFHGNCTIYFYNKPPKQLKIDFSAMYHSGHAISVSEDGSKMFVVPWENVIDGKRVGLWAYDIDTGTLLWSFPKGNVGSISVYDDDIVILGGGLAPRMSIFKLDINTGEVLGELKSGTLETLFELSGSYLLANSFRGKLSVVDVESMSVVKNYGSIFKSKVINPLNCYSVVVTEATVQDNILVISGFENHQNGVYDDNNDFEGKPFTRVIDDNFELV